MFGFISGFETLPISGLLSFSCVCGALFCGFAGVSMSGKGIKVSDAFGGVSLCILCTITGFDVSFTGGGAGVGAGGAGGGSSIFMALPMFM
jgi:hypothetical protein